jgi:hypothetical protein
VTVTEFWVLCGRWPQNVHHVKTWCVIRRLHSCVILALCDSVRLLYSSCVLVIVWGEDQGGNSGSAVLNEIKRQIVTKVLINPIIQTRTCHSHHAYRPTRDNIFTIHGDTSLPMFLQVQENAASVLLGDLTVCSDSSLLKIILTWSQTYVLHYTAPFMYYW